MNDSLPLVIALGHRQRGDDGVGPLVLDRLETVCDGKARFQEFAGDGAGLLELMDGCAEVIVIDAVHAEDAADGHVFELDGLHEELPQSGSLSSSHILGLSEALALGKVLGRLPEKLTIFGVAGSRFEQGAAPGDAVMQAIDQVTQAITARLLDGD